MKQPTRVVQLSVRPGHIVSDHSLITHEYTQVPASSDVCGKVDKNKLAYAKAQHPIIQVGPSTNLDPLLARKTRFPSKS